MTPLKHAQSSVRKWKGEVLDYLPIHEFFDETKQFTGDWTHRALRHHSAGVQWAVALFGHVITNADGTLVPVKMVAEQHVTEDCGFVPTPQDWLRGLADRSEPWMLRVDTKLVTERIQPENSKMGNPYD